MKSTSILLILAMVGCAKPPQPQGTLTSDKLVVGTGVVEPAKKKQVLGTWREGFKAAHTTALQFKSWNELYDWAEAGDNSIVLPLRPARSTDLAGGRHNYIDTYAAGVKDARIGIFDEMRFIGNHNSGDTAHFFQMTREWIQDQPLGEIIPPGHF